MLLCRDARIAGRAIVSKSGGRHPTSLLQNPLDTFYIEFALDLAFPDPNDSPTSSPEPRPDTSVALPVSLNLLAPVSNIALGWSITTGTAVPKASIDEQC